MIVPSHVPPELVVPFDHAHGSEVMAFPPAALDGLREERAVFYSTFYGGFWTFTRYDDIRAAYQNHELFKQHQGLPKAPYARTLIPLTLDPPDHIAYRRLLAPVFAPRQMALLEPIIRQVARSQLGKYAPTGRIEFSSQFALAVSAAMFCGQLGLPIEEFSFFNDLSFELVYGAVRVWDEQGEEAGKAYRVRKSKEIADYLADLIPQRRAQPGEDIISILLASEVNGRPLTEEELLNMSVLLFFAGTDSTAASVAYAHAFLAQNPGHKQQLIDRVDDDDFVWRASEELIRYHGFHFMTREVTRDAEFGGVQLKQGDVIALPTGSANRDESHFPGALKVDFERENAKTHLTFGAGVHRCVGSHLATLQLRIALQEVHRAIPDYRLESPVEYVSGGQKVIPHRVPFVFTPRQLAA